MIERWKFAYEFPTRDEAKHAAQSLMRDDDQIIARYRADLVESFGGPVGRWVVEVQPV